MSTKTAQRTSRAQRDPRTGRYRKLHQADVTPADQLANEDPEAVPTVHSEYEAQQRRKLMLEAEENDLDAELANGCIAVIILSVVMLVILGLICIFK